MSRSRSSSSKHHRKLNALNIWTMILLILVIAEIITAIFGLHLVNSMLADKPQLSVDDFFSQESSHIYDKDGNLIADVGTQLRENVTYNEISESLIDAFVSVEDSRYFVHDGFDLPRFTKAAIENVRSKLTGSGGLQGGSTFTMQLVKLTYFTNDETGQTNDQSISYKIQQIALAKELEQQADKKQIFEMYLNKMNFGGTGNIRGIEKASQYYYGKHAGELNLAEAAMLAGVINSPYYYDPHNFLDYATSRRNTVLYLMKRHGYITEQEYKLACMVKVEDTLVDPSTTSTGSTYAYQAYIDTVIKEAEQLTGQDPLNSAMEIYTCMDPTVQTVMDDIQAGNREEVQFPDDLMEMGAICENNQTGEVIAIAGGRNYGRGGSMLLNHAIDQYKQPGSSVKPFLDYALAFEYLGWATSHVVTDKPISYTGTNLVIRNANGVYHGQVTLDYAIAASLNTPAIQALQEVIDKVGYDTVTNYITSLGFSQVSADNFDLGFAIGGSNFTCSPEELAAAHAILMNGGNYIKPHTITKIEYRSGNTDPLVPEYTATNVLSPQASYLAAQLMYTAIHGGVYNYLQILERSYATYGKTGTTDWGSEGLQYNIPEGAMKDKWMVCDTTQYTIVTWIGYEKGVKDAGTYIDTAKSQLNIPGNICSLILDAATGDSQPAELAQPDGISTITHILGTFPYASPVDGMDPALITTGKIKSEYATLADPQAADSVDNLDSFQAELQDDGSVHLTWTAYPEPDKLQVADSTMDISLYDADGNVLVAAAGTRLFDWSWVYGPIRYKARISQNGAVVGEITSETEDTTASDLSLAPDTDTEACGYYGYESSDGSSNEVCVTFHTPKEEEPEPDATPAAAPAQDSGNQNNSSSSGSENQEDNQNSSGSNQNSNENTSNGTGGDFWPYDFFSYYWQENQH